MDDFDADVNMPKKETMVADVESTRDDAIGTAVKFAGTSQADPDDKTLRKEEGTMTKIKTSNQDVLSQPNNKSRNSVAEQWRRANLQRRGCRQRNPRCWAIIISILLPLWILIGISLLCGKLLARHESPREIEENDQIMANRFVLEFFDIRPAFGYLLTLPVGCYERYLDDEFVNKTSVTFEQAVASGNGTESNTAATISVLQDDGFGVGEFVTFLHGLYPTMEDCGKEIAPILDGALARQEEANVVIGSAPLTFNWIRCWNASEVGPHSVRRPTKEQIRAAADQAPFYQDVWRLNQQEIFDTILDDITDGNPSNATIEQRTVAFNNSVAEASGRSGCSVNAPGTAWFWFTVMTTVGYGNQAPITSGGRTMVAILGFVSIIVFAGILANAGSIVNVIWDDAIGRIKKYPFLKSPIFGCFVWALISFLWLWLLSSQALRWWVDRFEGEYDVSKLDSAWWAFITTTTVGLGDYFLQPEVIFAGDVFQFSFSVLVSFVFFATFLGQFSVLVSPYFADAGETLKKNLEATQILYETIEQIFGVEEAGEDNDHGTSKNVTRKETPDRSTIDSLEKILQAQVKREEEEKQKQGQALLSNEDVTATQAVKTQKEEKLRLLQEEAALLRQLIENNDRQQQLHAASNEGETVAVREPAVATSP